MFRNMMKKLNIPQTESGMASTIEEAIVIANRIKYPLMVRPSFVLGGRAMEVVYDEKQLRQYVSAAVDISPERPIMLDKFLENATETEADAISDGTDAFVPSVMEHIELAGIHSGDSACCIPPNSISQRHIDTIVEYTKRIAVEMGVVGLMNIQYAIARDTVYILEANPRASRTVPLVSKVCAIQMAALATQCMLGKKISELDIHPRHLTHYGVKEAVFPFNMFPEVDPILGPEMRSTGEVLGMCHSHGLAYFKAQEAANSPLPKSGCVLMTVNAADRPAVGKSASVFANLGFRILATAGTYDFLQSLGIPCERIFKIHEGTRPNILDAMKNGEVQLVINTPAGRSSQYDDSYIRKTAIRMKIPYITTIAAAEAAANGIQAILSDQMEIKSLQEYHAAIN